MATVQWMFDEAAHLQWTVNDHARIAEEQRRHEYLAAVTIQSWLRGTKVRQKLIKFHKSATSIQTVWRSFMARKVFRKLLKQKNTMMCITCYNQSATLIQRVWRGHSYRKNVHNFHHMKAENKRIVEQNRILREEIKEIYDKMAQQQLEEEQDVEKEKAYLSRIHYLQRTFHIPGIYSCFETNELTEMEQKLKALKFSTKKKQKILPPKHMTPITREPVRGPFRSQQEVQAQKEKKLQPTLQMLSPYDNTKEVQEEERVQEWVKRLHDNRFAGGAPPEPPYKPMITLEDPYMLPAYGRTHFRDTDKSKYVSSKDFRSQLPPIPLFSEFNRQYPGYPAH